MSTNGYFDISRKIIANMTTESWRTTPHVSVVFEPEVGLLLSLLREYNGTHEEAISLNSAVLKLIAEGLRANPALNGHIRYSRWLVSGCVTPCDHVDISMPVRYGEERMITVTLPRAETLSMLQIQRTVSDFRERIGRTDMQRTLYRTGLADTFDGLRKGKILTAAGRLLGAKLGKGRVRLAPAGPAPSGDVLKPEEIRQGSVTVSNMGALYRDWRGSCTLLEIVPPQLCAFGIGALQKRPVADEDGRIRAAEILPITIAFDHRALDFPAVAPFMKRLEDSLRDAGTLRSWMDTENTSL